MTQIKGFKFRTTLISMIKKRDSEDKRKYDNFYSRSKAEIIINEPDTDNMFQSIYTTIITNIQNYLAKGSSWVINSVIENFNKELLMTKKNDENFGNSTKC